MFLTSVLVTYFVLVSLENKKNSNVIQRNTSAINSWESVQRFAIISEQLSKEN